MTQKFNQGTFMNDEMISCRALYKASGFSDDDFSRPVIGICDSFTDIVPGHKNLRELSEQVKYGVYRAGGTPVEFGCIAVCDGVCTTHNGCFIGHISPEAAEGGPLALVQDGDRIIIDVEKRTLELLVDAEELELRKQSFHYTPPQTTGYLARYARDAQSADKGGVLK